MEYLDFSSVITTIRNYISDAHSMNQIDMMYQLFVSFLSSDESLDFDFDNLNHMREELIKSIPY